MRQLLDSQGLKHADAYSIKTWNIAEAELMERAGWKLKHLFLRHVKPAAGTHIIICCGKGNNAGDGLVMGRLLAFDFPVTVVLPGFTTDFSPSMELNLQRLKQLGGRISWVNTEANGSFHLPDYPSAVVLDALFGSGLKGSLKGEWKRYIEQLNSLGYPVVAVDIPSGLEVHGFPENPEAVVKAAATLSVDRPARNFLFPEFFAFTGKWWVAENVFHPDCAFVSRDNLPEFGEEIILDPIDFYAMQEELTPFAHKGTRGHGLLISGSATMPGAAVLCAVAAMHSGLGKLSVHCPEGVFNAVLNACPEAIYSVEQNSEFPSSFPADLHRFRALAFGPGCGTHADTATLLKLLIQEASCSMVLDADALTLLAENKTWLSFLPKGGYILTPHPAEFDRLTEPHFNGAERLETAKSFVRKTGVYLVLKGAYTHILYPDGRVFHFYKSNNGLGKAGSGDVLTGIILALLSRGYSPGIACLLGVMAHGNAGHLTSENSSADGMSAGDVANVLSGIWRY
jgi:ADP-dependent NAD(P)H-hydrate dehydratase / NAD(P)H-hydrate epimerase